MVPPGSSGRPAEPTGRAARGARALEAGGPRPSRARQKPRSLVGSSRRRLLGLRSPLFSAYAAGAEKPVNAGPVASHARGKPRKGQERADRLPDSRASSSVRRRPLRARVRARAAGRRAPRGRAAPTRGALRSKLGRAARGSSAGADRALRSQGDAAADRALPDHPHPPRHDDVPPAAGADIRRPRAIRGGTGSARREASPGRVASAIVPVADPGTVPTCHGALRARALGASLRSAPHQGARRRGGVVS